MLDMFVLLQLLFISTLTNTPTVSALYFECLLELLINPTPTIPTFHTPTFIPS